MVGGECAAAAAWDSAVVSDRVEQAPDECSQGAA